MKITIDTDQTPHRIEVKGSASLGELIEFLSKYYPDFTWKELRIGDGTMVVEIKDWMKQGTTKPGYPWNQPLYHSTAPTNIIGTTTDAATFTAGLNK